MWFFGSKLAADLRRLRPSDTPSVSKLLAVVARNPGMLACVFLRAQENAVRRGMSRTADVIRHLGVFATGADFLPGCSVAAGLLLPHPNGVVLGAGARVGLNCTILQQVTLGEKDATGAGPHLYPVIGDDVIVGAGARILGGIEVGRQVKIGANAVVLFDVPEGERAVGVPARILKS